MLHETGDNISGKQIDYDLPKLVILVENAFHVMGFNLFNIIYRGHIISPIFGKFFCLYPHWRTTILDQYFLCGVQGSPRLHRCPKAASAAR